MLKTAIAVLLLALFTPMLAMSQDSPANLLPECPDTPNCVRASYPFKLLPSELADHVMAVFKDMDAQSIDIGNVDSHEIMAVFKIMGFLDDVHVMISADQEGSLLHIRSASRVGKSDLGVNKRRVKKILKKLEAAINS
ncbi:MAG: DUF1499 domain-containing protein [Bacteroidota bacterium]